MGANNIVSSDFTNEMLIIRLLLTKTAGEHRCSEPGRRDPAVEQRRSVSDQLQSVSEQLVAVPYLA